MYKYLTSIDNSCNETLTSELTSLFSSNCKIKPQMNVDLRRDDGINVVHRP